MMSSKQRELWTEFQQLKDEFESSSDPNKGRLVYMADSYINHRGDGFGEVLLVRFCELFSKWKNGKDPDGFPLSGTKSSMSSRPKRTVPA